MKRLFIFVSVVLFFSGEKVAENRNKTELVLPDVIIRSFYRGENKVPLISHHYDLIDPIPIKEPEDNM